MDTVDRCKHCGLELTEYQTEFCCSGCSVAHQAILGAGLGDQYYSLRKLVSSAEGVPARAGSAPVLSKQQIASDRFVQESTREIGGGNRQACLAIDGLTCAACGWLAEQVVESEDGMWNASVNLPDATITFDFDPDQAALSSMMDSLARFGYDLHPRKDRPNGPTPQERKLLVKVGVSWALAGNVMLLAFALYSGLSLEDAPLYAGAARWASFVIAAVSVAYGGSVFFRTASASLRAAVVSRSFRHLHIDTPISLGILVGFFHSGWSTLTSSGEVWFDSITVLIAALLTARWLQMRSQRTASQAASRLLDLVPSTARRINPDGSVEYLASEDVSAGESLRIDPGEIVAADGVILSGRSIVNNAVITGESVPVRVAPGDKVFAGATNQSSPIIVRADSSGKQTRIGKLLEWLQESSGQEASVVQTADRISGYFVIGIVLAAIATAVVGAFLFPDDVAFRIVALLVISCPCALGMATPLAIAAANGKAARRGIYVKDGATVEGLATIDAVVFDKTGTLTLGDVAVVETRGDLDSISFAAALERHTSHPLAEAIVTFDNSRNPRGTELFTESVRVIDGSGISGEVSGAPLSSENRPGS